MADGEVKIDTSIDTSGLDEGLKKLNVSLQNLGVEAEQNATKVNKLNNAISETEKKEKKTEAQTSKTTKKRKEATKETEKYTAVLKQANGAIGGTTSGLMQAAASYGPYVAGIIAAIGALKKLGDTMRDCTDAYNTQEKAEKALEVAARNNPYINNESIAALKTYASELQNISNIGDETSIQLMAELVSTGRTQEEIQKIMSAAANYAAATQTDIKSAVQTLNMTYSGMSGTLGRQINDIKDLTEEELKHGKAVDIIAKKYAGMAQAMADAKTQTENIKGDFKETLGELFKPTVDLWDRFWGGFYNAGMSVISSINEALENASRKWSFGGISRSVNAGVDVVTSDYTNRTTGKTESGVKMQTTEYLQWLQKELELRGELDSLEQTALIYIKDELGYRERAAKWEAQQAEAAKKRTEELEKQKKLEDEIRNKADDAAKQSNKSLDAALKKIDLEAELTGKTGVAQAKYNAIMQNYIALLTQTDATIEKDYPVAKKRLEQLEAAKKALDEETEAEKKLQLAIEATTAVTETIQSVPTIPAPKGSIETELKHYAQLRKDLEALNEADVEAAQAGNENIYSKAQLLQQLAEAEVEIEKNKLKEVTDQEKSYIDKYAEQQQQLLQIREEIDRSEVLSEEEKERQKAEIDKKYAQNKIKLWADIVNEINGYTQQTVQIAQEAGALMLEDVQTQTALELAELENKYSKGEVSEEEYYEKQKQIRRKAAQEEYKIKMFEWTASMLAATANIAEGVSKALAQGYPAGLITGALVGAAGAVQIASIVAAKPVPPQFREGGIIGGAIGASYGADNIDIRARRGEMVLNAYQQRSLWDKINGQAPMQNSGLNLTVNNTQSNRVDANVREQNGEVFIDILDKHINKGFSDGTYDAGFAAMNTRQEGVRIL